MYSRIIAHCLIPPSYLPLLIIECKMPILFLIYPIYIHRHYRHSFTVYIYIPELMTRSQQRPSWLSWKMYTLAKYPYRLPLLVYIAWCKHERESLGEFESLCEPESQPRDYISTQDYINFCFKLFKPWASIFYFFYKIRLGPITACIRHNLFYKIA